MKVYKFGGASVKDANGVRNVERIIRMNHTDDGLMVVVSAMGKTTNALERVVEFCDAGKEEAALNQWIDIIDFHVQFEHIHPFQDGNGRVGRLVVFKECLANGIVPFIITDDLKFFYYRGLREWGHINGYLTDTCLTAQDNYKALLDYFKIKH